MSERNDETEMYSEEIGELIDIKISGETFKEKVLTCVLIDGKAIFEGDIVLGTFKDIEFEEMPQTSGTPDETPQLSGMIHSSLSRRWPGGVIPYTFASGFPDGAKSMVEDAIQHWHDLTKIQLVPYTNQDDYLEFQEGTGNSSDWVGRIGGKQCISLNTSLFGFSVGNAIHEIGHVVGLWHEQSRNDRDDYVKIHYDNIMDKKDTNFNQRVSDGDDVGPYDYGSIMHYSAYAWAKNPLLPTITTVPPGREFEIGQRNGLSEGDKDAVAIIYETSGGKHLQVSPKKEIKFYDNQVTSFQITIKNPNDEIDIIDLEILIEIPYTTKDSLVHVPDQSKKINIPLLNPLETRKITIELNIKEFPTEIKFNEDFYFGCRLRISHDYEAPISSDFHEDLSLKVVTLCVLPRFTKNYVLGHVYFKTKDGKRWPIPGANVSLFSNVSENILHDYSDDIPDGRHESGTAGGYLIIADNKFYRMKVSCPGFYSQYRDVELRGNDPVELDVQLFHRPPSYDGSGFYDPEASWILANCIIGVPHPSEDPNWVPDTEGLEPPVEEEEPGWTPE